MEITTEQFTCGFTPKAHKNCFFNVAPIARIPGQAHGISQAPAIFLLAILHFVINDGKFNNNEFNDVYLVTTVDPIPLEAFTLQLTGLSNTDRKTLGLLIKAAKLMDEIFYLQAKGDQGKQSEKNPKLGNNQHPLLSEFKPNSSAESHQHAHTRGFGRLNTSEMMSLLTDDGFDSSRYRHGSSYQCIKETLL
ncbi:hypothetical protein NC652_009639 [Populus alba x Populus x berolinensis]|nr:hypothetical protein NC652_009639 [Populus alba x Populus x berolinensis]